MLLDKIAADEREALTKTIESKETIIEEQRPRMVPSSKADCYRYLIWKEPSTDDSDKVILHLVRRHKSNFRQVSKHYKNKDENWFFRSNLPIAMSPNDEIKDLIKKQFPGSEYVIKGNKVTISQQHLPRLHDLIANYFDKFQQ